MGCRNTTHFNKNDKMEFNDITKGILPFINESVELSFIDNEDENETRQLKFYLKKINIIKELQIFYYSSLLVWEESEKDTHLKIMKLDKQNIYNLFCIISLIIDISENEFSQLHNSQYDFLFNLVMEKYLDKINTFFLNEDVKKFLDYKEKDPDDLEREIEEGVEQKEDSIETSFFSTWSLIYKMIKHFNIPEPLYELIDLSFLTYAFKRKDKEDAAEKIEQINILESVVFDALSAAYGDGKNKGQTNTENLKRQYSIITGRNTKRGSGSTALFKDYSKEDLKYDSNPLNDPWLKEIVEKTNQEKTVN